MSLTADRPPVRTFRRSLRNVPLEVRAYLVVLLVVTAAIVVGTALRGVIA